MTEFFWGGEGAEQLGKRQVLQQVFGHLSKHLISYFELCISDESSSFLLSSPISWAPCE